MPASSKQSTRARRERSMGSRRIWVHSLWDQFSSWNFWNKSAPISTPVTKLRSLGCECCLAWSGRASQVSFKPTLIGRLKVRDTISTSRNRWEYNSGTCINYLGFRLDWNIFNVFVSDVYKRALCAHIETRAPDVFPSAGRQSLTEGMIWRLNFSDFSDLVGQL